MSTPFLGEIRIVSFDFPPKGWAFCDGQILPVNQNQTLYSILGATYGGDGTSTFALPDLRGRTPIHLGTGYTLGQRGGEEAHTLTPAELPAHKHTATGSSNNADLSNPGNAFWATVGLNAYAATANATMDGQAVSTVGGNQPHLNLSPYLVLNFIIALRGDFPSP